MPIEDQLEPGAFAESGAEESIGGWSDGGGGVALELGTVDRCLPAGAALRLGCEPPADCEEGKRVRDDCRFVRTRSRRCTASQGWLMASSAGNQQLLLSLFIAIDATLTHKQLFAWQDPAP